jgi:hypothetical protein
MKDFRLHFMTYLQGPAASLKAAALFTKDHDGPTAAIKYWVPHY